VDFLHTRPVGLGVDPSLQHRDGQEPWRIAHGVIILGFIIFCPLFKIDRSWVVFVMRITPAHTMCPVQHNILSVDRINNYNQIVATHVHIC
jgi:hypothetical protein